MFVDPVKTFNGTPFAAVLGPNGTMAAPQPTAAADQARMTAMIADIETATPFLGANGAPSLQTLLDFGTHMCHELALLLQSTGCGWDPANPPQTAQFTSFSEKQWKDPTLNEGLLPPDNEKKVQKITAEIAKHLATGMENLERSEFYQEDVTKHASDTALTMSQSVARGLLKKRKKKVKKIGADQKRDELKAQLPAIADVWMPIIVRKSKGPHVATYGTALQCWEAFAKSERYAKGNWVGSWQSLGIATFPLLAATPARKCQENERIADILVLANQISQGDADARTWSWIVKVLEKIWGSIVMVESTKGRLYAPCVLNKLGSFFETITAQTTRRRLVTLKMRLSHQAKGVVISTVQGMAGYASMTQRWNKPRDYEANLKAGIRSFMSDLSHTGYFGGANNSKTTVGLQMWRNANMTLIHQMAVKLQSLQRFWEKGVDTTGNGPSLRSMTTVHECLDYFRGRGDTSLQTRLDCATQMTKDLTVLANTYPEAKKWANIVDTVAKISFAVHDLDDVERGFHSASGVSDETLCEDGQYPTKQALTDAVFYHGPSGSSSVSKLPPSLGSGGGGPGGGGPKPPPGPKPPDTKKDGGDPSGSSSTGKSDPKIPGTSTLPKADPSIFHAGEGASSNKQQRLADPTTMMIEESKHSSNANDGNSSEASDSSKSSKTKRSDRKFTIDEDEKDDVDEVFGQKTKKMKTNDDDHRDEWKEMVRQSKEKKMMETNPASVLQTTTKKKLKKGSEAFTMNEIIERPTENKATHDNVMPRMNPEPKIYYAPHHEAHDKGAMVGLTDDGWSVRKMQIQGMGVTELVPTGFAFPDSCLAHPDSHNPQFWHITTDCPIIEWYNGTWIVKLAADSSSWIHAESGERIWTRYQLDGNMGSEQPCLWRWIDRVSMDTKDTCALLNLCADGVGIPRLATVPTPVEFDRTLDRIVLYHMTLTTDLFACVLGQSPFPIVVDSNITKEQVNGKYIQHVMSEMQKHCHPRRCILVSGPNVQLVAPSGPHGQIWDFGEKGWWTPEGGWGALDVQLGSAVEIEEGNITEISLTSATVRTRTLNTTTLGCRNIEYVLDCLAIDLNRRDIHRNPWHFYGHNTEVTDVSLYDTESSMQSTPTEKV